MQSHSLKLFTTNVVAVIVWLQSVQVFIGALAALVGLISGFMLVCINWSKFEESKPYRLFCAWYRARKHK